MRAAGTEPACAIVPAIEPLSDASTAGVSNDGKLRCAGADRHVLPEGIRDNDLVRRSETRLLRIESPVTILGEEQC